MKNQDFKPVVNHLSKVRISKQITTKANVMEAAVVLLITFQR